MDLITKSCHEANYREGVGLIPLMVDGRGVHLGHPFVVRLGSLTSAARRAPSEPVEPISQKIRAL